LLDTLLDEGFGYHATESERLAGELEAAAAEARATPPKWAPYLKLATHTIGEHLFDWPRSRRLAERVLGDAAADAGTAKSWGYLWLAKLMEGDVAGAGAAELVLLGATDSDARAAVIDLRFMLVAALISCKRAAEAQGLYAAALALAKSLGDGAPSRAIAVATNNLASELLEAPSRTPEEDALMRAAADAAHEYWLKCGTWVNEERARYLQALVANALGEPKRALRLIEEALALIAKNGEEPIDATFLGLARANALRLAGDPAASAGALAASDASAAAWDDDGLKAWYAEERAKVAP
jgi:hypothetical protein